MSEFVASRLDEDTRVERSLFGTDDPGGIWAEVLEACPEAQDCFAFHVSVGALFGLRLRDGSRVALKFHREADRLRAVQSVQDSLHRRGFPCPRPLGVRGRVTLEEWRDEGEERHARERGVRTVLAATLAELVRLTGETGVVAGLERGKREGLWPPPHNVLFDFEATNRGAEWIDEIAANARAASDVGGGREVVGHGDWTVKHFRFDGLEPTVVYDWDSLSRDWESVFVGWSAATYTYTERFAGQVWTTLEEALAFVDDYETARGQAFDAAERRAVVAATVYARAYGARCVHALGQDAAAASALEEFAAALL